LAYKKENKIERGFYRKKIYWGKETKELEERENLPQGKSWKIARYKTTL